MKECPIADPQDRTEIHIANKRYTHGCGPAGYDLRLADETFSLGPNEFTLASAMELFQMPDDVLGIVHDKSSWIRQGISVHNTVIEPGWNGFLTLEIKNVGTEPLFLFQGVGICQVVFHRLESTTDKPYDGKYQNQSSGPQTAI